MGGKFNKAVEAGRGAFGSSTVSKLNARAWRAARVRRSSVK